MDGSPEPDFIAQSLPGSDDTIVAIATAQGRGALALIRLSGPRAFEIARSITVSWPEAPRHVILSAIGDHRTGILLDRALVVRYDAPQSYTGENVVELTTHGGALVPSTVIAALIQHGARQAAPGEFTRRAVLNGKLDLVQAEAVGDLVDARSRRGQAIALAQLDGGLSRRIGELRSALIGIEALLAYDIDFPEEDDGPVPARRIILAAENILADLTALRATASTGELVRDGAVVVLAGAPNVGKSSLFNALLGQTRAIVTDVPGTTRDALEAVIDAGTWALRLVDTAGLRQASDRIEQMGIEMSERYLDRAAIVLACGDSASSIDAAVTRVRARTTAPIIVARTKADLEISATEEHELVANGYQYPSTGESLPVVIVSAETGTGLDALVARIAQELSAQHASIPLDAPVLTRVRHARAVEEARREVDRFRYAWVEENLPASVAATHLRNAIISLEELIGAVDVEDVLDRVFSSFCVGK
jgi:tRNA modification GTPase